MTLLVNPSKLKFEVPRFPIDKIVFSSSGSFDVNASDINTITVTHNLNRKCLSEMIWSSNGTDFNDAGAETDIAGVVQGCGLNTAKIYGYNLSGAKITINYTLYLIWPI